MTSQRTYLKIFGASLTKMNVTFILKLDVCPKTRKPSLTKKWHDIHDMQDERYRHCSLEPLSFHNRFFSMKIKNFIDEKIQNLGNFQKLRKRHTYLRNRVNIFFL